MADRYGDDMAFRKMMEERTESNLISNDTSTRDNTVGVSKPATQNLAQSSTIKSTPNQFDKNCWEYWEQNVPNRFNPYDGRSVAAVEANSKEQGDKMKKSSSSG